MLCLSIKKVFDYIWTPQRKCAYILVLQVPDGIEGIEATEIILNQNQVGTSIIFQEKFKQVKNANKILYN